MCVRIRYAGGFGSSSAATGVSTLSEQCWLTGRSELVVPHPRGLVDEQVLPVCETPGTGPLRKSLNRVWIYRGTGLEC